MPALSLAGATNTQFFATVDDWKSGGGTDSTRLSTPASDSYTEADALLRSEETDKVTSAHGIWPWVARREKRRALPMAQCY
jgi:hypothetical protein